MLIDSHVNLHAPQFDDDREAVIERARAAGVGLMVDICDKVSSTSRRCAPSPRRTPTSGRTVGTHPHEAKDDPELTRRNPDAIWPRDPKVVGIGETGLDFHYDLSPRDVQAAGVPRPYRRGARHRPAAGGPHPRGRRGDGRDPGGGARRAAPFRILMHCYTSGAGAGARARRRWAPGSRSPASPPSRPPRTCAR